MCLLCMCYQKQHLHYYLLFVNLKKLNHHQHQQKLNTPDELVCKNLSVAGAVAGKVKV